MVVCKQCNEAFHPECHRPKIEAQDRDHWFCRFCVLSKSVTRFVPSLLAKKVRKTYPYDIKALQWIEGGKQNKDERYCYCGGPGDWNLKMIKVIFFFGFLRKKISVRFLFSMVSRSVHSVNQTSVIEWRFILPLLMFCLLKWR